jgi:hypothetical protein
LPDPLNLVFFGLFALAGVLSYALAYRFFAFGLAVALTAYAAISILDGNIGVSVGGINLYINDGVYGLLFAAGITRAGLRRKAPWTLWMSLLFLYSLVVLYSYARGLQEFGLQSPSNEFRSEFYLIAGALYVSSFNFSKALFKTFSRLWVASATILVGLTIFRWIAELLGLSIASLWLYDGRGPMRVLGSDDALYLAQAAFLCLYLSFFSDRQPLWRGWSYTFFIVAFLLQHRTVWFVLILCSLLTLWREPTIRPILVRLLVVGSLLIILVLSLTFGRDGVEALNDRSTNTGTFEWRVKGWQMLIESQLNSVETALLGRPFGTGYRREFVPGYPIDVSPHNHYLSVLLRGGAAGLLLWMALYTTLLHKLNRLRHAAFWHAVSSRILTVFLVSQLVYSVTYSPSSVQGLIIGLAMGLTLSNLAPSVMPKPSAAGKEFSWSR